MNKSKLKRIIIFIVIGIVLSTVLYTIFITLGYFDAYKHLPERQAIDILGMPIYILEKTGQKYTGTPVNSNMSFIGIIFIILTVIIGEFLYFRKHKKAAK